MDPIRLVALSTLALALTAAAGAEESAAPRPGAAWAGIRSSVYGMPLYQAPKAKTAGWPAPAEISQSLEKMATYFPGAKPAAIWIVGHLEDEGCGLEFPQPAGYRGTDPHIVFTGTPKSGKRAHASHEDYLNYFDAHGISVFLQVESGKGDMKTLIDLVLNQYGRHPSVVGFGVDAEWYNTDTAVGEDAGEVVSDAAAREWEAAVKAHNPAYRLFLKHYDKNWLCPGGYRGDIVFVDDSCRFRDSHSYITEFKAFADHFYPNTVFYQVGYQDDRSWWSLLDAPADPDYNLPVSVPPQALGQMLAAETRQDCGIFWVDFTLDKVLPPYVKPRI